MKSNEFDAVIFDYGGVLVHHQTDEDQRRMASLAGISVEDFTRLYWEHRLEYDEDLPAQEYWQRLAREAGTKFTPEQIAALTDADSFSWMHYDEPMWEYIASLRQSGIRVAMLSNMPRDLGNALRVHSDRLDRFDHVTLSYELRCAKPHPEIYRECLKGTGTEPARTLFLDDRIANVHGAEAVGMRALQFTSRQDTLPRLAELQLVR